MDRFEARLTFDSTLLVFFCFFLSTCCLAAETVSADRIERNTRFALEIHLGTRTNVPVDEGLPTTNSVSGGFFIGAHASRATLGIGLVMSRFAVRWKAGEEEAKDTVTTLHFVPGLRVVLARSTDGKVELFGQFDIGFGSFVFTSDDIADENDDSHFHLTYAVAPGVRYWFHPQFSLGASSGFLGDVLFVSPKASNYSRISHHTGVFGALAMTGLF